MRKVYILLKDTPELKKGAVLREKCDDGDQDFECINMSTKQKFKNQNACVYDRKVVMRQPEYFEEVCNVTVAKSVYKELKEKFKNKILNIK